MGSSSWPWRLPPTLADKKGLQQRAVKRGVFGTFHSISEAHLHLYLNEFDFRANTRHLSDAERSATLLARAKGKRLLYRQPD
jgi:hypothetical protein